MCKAPGSICSNTRKNKKKKSAHIFFNMYHHVSFLSFFFFSPLWVEHRALLNVCSTTVLHPQTLHSYFLLECFYFYLFSSSVLGSNPSTRQELYHLSSASNPSAYFLCQFGFLLKKVIFCLAFL
jgi:hypothetical protein